MEEEALIVSVEKEAQRIERSGDLRKKIVFNFSLNAASKFLKSIF